MLAEQDLPSWRTGHRESFLPVPFKRWPGPDQPAGARQFRVGRGGVVLAPGRPGEWHVAIAAQGRLAKGLVFGACRAGELQISRDLEMRADFGRTLQSGCASNSLREVLRSTRERVSELDSSAPAGDAVVCTVRSGCKTAPERRHHPAKPQPLQAGLLPPILRKCALSVFLLVTAATPSG